MLYELLTGCRAFKGETRASTLAAVRKDEPKPASHIAVDLPKEVDNKNEFFIPNGRKKHWVGENAGHKLNAAGGIEVYVAAEKPAGVPEENWLPIVRKDENLDIILRVYNPDLQKMKTWTPRITGATTWHFRVERHMHPHCRRVPGGVFSSTTPYPLTTSGLSWRDRMVCRGRRLY